MVRPLGGFSSSSAEFFPLCLRSPLRRHPGHRYAYFPCSRRREVRRHYGPGRAYDLPTEAWSLACNVRFQNRKVARGPVWRAVQFVVGNTFNTGQDDLFIGYESGDVKQCFNGAETPFNPPGLNSV